MIHRILVNPGSPQAWEISLRPGLNHIGSSTECDFTIDHPSISPRHCALQVSEAGVQLKDLDSKNGTFVNGTPVRELWLQSGQQIQLGAVAAIFESHHPVSQSPPVSQPAPGATVIVAAFGSPPVTETPLSPGAPTGQRQADLESPDQSAARSSAESSVRPKKFPVHLAAERDAARKTQFILGVLGAILGGLFGVFTWLLLIKSTGSPLLLMAWAVGGLTGLAAVRLAKSGGLPLGMASAICALAAIIGGECLAAKAIRSQETLNRALSAYRSQLEFAKEALRAQAPEDFRKLLTRVNQKNPDEISDEQINRFQEEELPSLRNFALGKPSKAEFTEETVARLTAEFDYQEFFLHEDVKSGLFLAIFAVLGIATAYKVGSGKSAPA